MVPEKNWGPVPSPDPTPEDPGVWKAPIGQVWVICPVLQLGLGQVLETQGLRMGVTLLQEAGQSIAGGC